MGIPLLVIWYLYYGIVIPWLIFWEPGRCFYVKMLSGQYRHSPHEDKMVLQLSNLYDENQYKGTSRDSLYFDMGPHFLGLSHYKDDILYV